MGPFSSYRPLSDCITTMRRMVLYTPVLLDSLGYSKKKLGRRNFRKKAREATQQARSSLI